MGFVLVGIFNIQFQGKAGLPAVAGWRCPRRLICFSGSGIAVFFL
jgi:hypothetical protein